MKPHKKDTSARIHQREKLTVELNLRQFPWTDKQKALIQLVNSPDSKIIFIKGPAGSAKTSTSMYAALDLLNRRKVSDIVLIRSAVESADSKLGFLPGDLSEKFGVYMTPFNDKLDMFITQTEIRMLQNDNRLVVCPINYARGLEWNVKCAIADEAQNMTFRELVTMITRVGEHSKLIVCADPDQTDLNNGKGGGFLKLWQLFNDDESKKAGIFCVEFDEEDILRSEIVKFIVKKLKSV